MVSGMLSLQASWDGYNSGGAVTHHTFFFRKTEDYGATWTTTGGLDGSGYNYIPDDILDDILYDAGLLGDSLWFLEGEDTSWFYVDDAFAGYDYDVKVDNDGGLHIMSNMVVVAGDSTVYVGLEGCGHYHFYNATPDDPSGWEASMVRDMSVSFGFEYGSDGFSGWQYNYPDMAMTPDGQVIWAVTYVADDTSNGSYGDIDLYASRSSDGGQTWEDLGNLTNTSSGIVVRNYETHPHFAPLATDSTAYLLYQQPDFSLNSVGGTNFEDYKQWLHFGKLVYPDTVTATGNAHVIPDGFALFGNYPNPFNPTTSIKFQLDKTLDVTISIYSVLGEEVATLHKSGLSQGINEVVWDASSISGEQTSSGVYFYRVEAGSQSLTGKMLLLK